MLLLHHLLRIITLTNLIANHSNLISPADYRDNVEASSHTTNQHLLNNRGMSLVLLSLREHFKSSRRSRSVKYLSLPLSFCLGESGSFQ